MDWRDLFPRKILIRGLQYYNKGKVKGYVEQRTSCMARVLGTQIYRVMIQGLDTEFPEMTCTCRYAMDGNLCKHMAAVLYEWDERHGRTPESEKQYAKIVPFPPSKERAALYYDLSHMTRKLEFHADVCQEAQKIVQQGRICRGELQTFYDEYGGVEGLGAQIRGTLKGSSREGVRLIFDRNKIVSAECYTCSHRYTQRYAGYYGETKELCVHETALLYLLDAYLLQVNPGDATDQTASTFMETFGSLQTNRKLREDKGRSRQVRLLPRVILDEGGQSLGFKIGIGKMFVVRNLTDLVETYTALGSLSLGKSDRILFSGEDFDETSMGYYRMIEKHVSEAQGINEQMQKRHRYYSEDVSLKGQMPLAGAVLDELYEMAQGEAVECTDKTGRILTGKQLRVRERKMDLALTLRPQKKPRSRGGKDAPEMYEGIHVSGVMPHLLEGASHSYYLQDDVLSRLSEKDYSYLAPFIHAAGAGDLSFTVGTKNLQEFYYRILPALREKNGIRIQEEEPEVIAGLLPPEVSFSFYLDQLEGELTLRGTCTYEEQKCDLAYPAGGTHYAAYRDAGQEARALEAVSEFFPRYEEETHTFAADADEDTVFCILDAGVRRLMEFGEVSATDVVHRMRIRKTPQIQVGVSVESGLFDLEVLSSELTSQELLEVLESYQKKKRYHRLRSGEFIRLEEETESLEMLSSMMKSLGVGVREFVQGKMHLPLYRALYVDQMLEEHEEVSASRDRRFRSLVKNFKTVKESDFDLPEALEGVLRKYQTYGYKWMRTLAEAGFSGILADDMGLGKTLQMIAVFLAQKKEGRGGTSLIVCPASLVYNWQEEIRRFAPELTAMTVSGTVGERRAILKEAEKADVLITSYDLLKRDIDLYEGHTFSWQVLDEAQYIKNPKAAASKAVKVVRSENRMALTGTPIENRLSELWSIFDFLMPGFLYGYERFRTEYETPIAKYKEEEVTQRLKKMVSPFILRRLKADVLKDLPEKLEEVRYARFDKDQRELYDGQVVRMRELLSSPDFQAEGGRFRLLAEMTHIRQICCDPTLLVEGYSGESAKRKACLELIESAIDGGHRLLVFSQFTSMLALLEEDLKGRGIDYYKITGSTPKQERIRLVHAYNEGEVPVFLISLKAGGTGLNLTGADVVVHYDPWWNLAAQNQATDRAHRIGQTRSVAVYRLIVKDTIEEKILQLQEAKKDLADAILSGESESLSQLSQEQLLELLA